MNELKTFDDEHIDKSLYDLLCDKIGRLSPSDMENVSDYIDFVINKRK